MKFAPLLLLLLLASDQSPVRGFSGPTLRELSKQLQDAPLDPDACFRVRDFSWRRNEARFFFNDGVIIFRKPVQGVRTAAIFLAEEEIGDAELLLIPPNRLERRSLAAFTGSATLDEHFRSAAFVFTDNTAEDWLKAIVESPLSKRSQERGQLLAEKWNETVRNLSASLENRILEDLANRASGNLGFFFAAIMGKEKGTFDLYFDPRGQEELLLGQLVSDEKHSGYNFWAHFEPKRPTPRVPPPPPAKILSYEVIADVDAQLGFHAKVAIEVESNRDSLAALPFDLSSRLEVKSATWNGSPVEVFQREALRDRLLRSGEAEGLLVSLPAPLSKGQRGIVEFEEQGQILLRAGNGVVYLAARATWFPQMQFQPAPFRSTFRHPKNLMIVCPGERTEKVEGDLKRTTCTVTNPVRLFGFNVGDFQSETAKRGGFDVEVFANKQVEQALERRTVTTVVTPPTMRRGPASGAVMAIPNIPPNSTARLGVMTDEIASALEYFRSFLGNPAMTRIVAAPIPGSFGQGFPGFLYLSTLAYIEEGSLPAAERAEWSNRYFRDLLQAHEVAHQWWGNLVTVDNYRDEWLTEALANYSAMMFLERRKGSKALEVVLEEYKRRLLVNDVSGEPIEGAGPVVMGMRLRYANPRAWQAVTYEKGSWILHMLRQRLGDQEFQKALGELAQQFTDHPLRTEDVRRIMASHLPKDYPDKDLEGFFDTWVYGTGVPLVEMTSKVQGTAGKLTVQLTVKQSKVPEDYTVDVPVELTFAKGPKMTRWIRTSNEAETMDIRVPAAPLKVLLDPRGTTLRR